MPHNLGKCLLKASYWEMEKLTQNTTRGSKMALPFISAFFLMFLVHSSNTARNDEVKAAIRFIRLSQLLSMLLWKGAYFY